MFFRVPKDDDTYNAEELTLVEVADDYTPAFDGDEDEEDEEVSQEAQDYLERFSSFF
jgi:hypothetical protein